MNADGEHELLELGELVVPERPAESTLRPGLELVGDFIVAEPLVTDVGGSLDMRVLSTPGMIAVMERCSALVAYANLPEGDATVGFEVCIRHVSAAAEGARCTVRSTLREIADDRKLRFDVEVTEGDRTIGTGTHERRKVPTSGPGS